VLRPASLLFWVWFAAQMAHSAEKKNLGAAAGIFILHSDEM